MVAIDPGIRIRTTRSLPRTRTETACRYDAPETAAMEIALWFTPEELVNYQTVDVALITGVN